MSSAVQAVTTVVGGVIGFAVGGPKGAYYGASLGYRIGDQDEQEKGPSKTYSLGKFGMTRSHRLPVPVVYGEHLVSGNVIYEDIYGGEENNQNLDICLAVSEGPIESITEIQADEVTLGSGFYELRLGERSQTPVSFNDDNFSYTAYIGAKLDAEELELNGSPTISALVQGRKIDVYNGTNWTNQYSNNPAWVVYDFLTNSRYGMGFDDEDLDENSFLSVADWCDTNNYTLNIVLDSQQSTLDILQSMLQAFNSFLVYTGGQISLRADTVEDEIVQYFDQDTNIILDSFSYSQASKREIPNKISVEYVDPNENWEMVEAYYSNDQDIEDRGEVINQNVTLYGVTNFDQAGRVARTLFNKQYYNRNLCQFETTIKAIECEPGDVIAITHDLPGWVNKEFRVLEVREKEDDTMLLVCKEYNASVYTDEGVVYQQPTGPTLPNPWERPAQIAAPFTLSEQRYQAKDGHHYSTVLIEWTKPNDPFYKYANIYIREVGGQWKSTPNGKVEGTEFETEALDEGNYEILLLSENRNGIKATFGEAPSQTIEVEGKQAEPSDVTVKTSRFINTITIEWFHINDNDLSAYELRTNQSFGSDDDNLIYRGDNNKITLDDLPLPTFSEGTRSYTFYLKAKNNSGNYSVNATEITVENAEPNPPTVGITEFFESLWIELEPPAGDPSINGFEIEVTPEGGTTEVFNVSAGERLTYSAEAKTSYDIRARSYDIIGSGPWSIVYTASTKDIDSITQFASALRPATIVESLPVLPSDSYPVESYVTLVARDTGGDITSVELYRNDNDSWVQIQSPDLENGMAVWPRVIAGTIQAGAISTDELAANSITAEKVGTNEIITELANINQAVIDELRVNEVIADNIQSGNLNADIANINGSLTFKGPSQTFTKTWASEFDLNATWDSQVATGETWAPYVYDIDATYDALKINAYGLEAVNQSGDTTLSIDFGTGNAKFRGELNADDLVAGTLDANQIDVINLDVASGIEANSITADKLNISQLSSISADIGTITAGSIDAGIVNTGKLDASNIVVTNLSADSINTGTLDTNRIGNNAIDAIKLQLNSWYSVEETPGLNLTFRGSTATLTPTNQPLDYVSFLNYTTKNHENKIRMICLAEASNVTGYIRFKVNGATQQFSVSSTQTTYSHTFSVSPNTTYDLVIEAEATSGVGDLFIYSGAIFNQNRSLNTYS